MMARDDEAESETIAAQSRDGRWGEYFPILSRLPRVPHPNSRNHIRITRYSGEWKVNAISVSPSSHAERNAVVVYDVDRCIRSWGRFGIRAGGLFGVVLGTIFVANPLTADALTFGTIGTLIVCAMECAVIAGAFGVSIAAFRGRGVLRAETTRLDWIRATPREAEDHLSPDMSPQPVMFAIIPPSSAAAYWRE